MFPQVTMAPSLAVASSTNNSPWVRLPSIQWWQRERSKEERLVHWIISEYVGLTTHGEEVSGSESYLWEHLARMKGWIRGYSPLYSCECPFSGQSSGEDILVVSSGPRGPGLRRWLIITDAQASSRLAVPSVAISPSSHHHPTICHISRWIQILKPSSLSRKGSWLSPMKTSTPILPAEQIPTHCKSLRYIQVMLSQHSPGHPNKGNPCHYSTRVRLLCLDHVVLWMTPSSMTSLQQPTMTSFQSPTKAPSLPPAKLLPPSLPSHVPSTNPDLSPHYQGQGQQPKIPTQTEAHLMTTPRLNSKILSPGL